MRRREKREKRERRLSLERLFYPLARCSCSCWIATKLHEESRQAPSATRNFLKPCAKATRWRSRGLAAHFYFVRKVWRVYQGHRVYRSKPRTRASLIEVKKTDLSSLDGTIEIVDYIDTRRPRIISIFLAFFAISLRGKSPRSFTKHRSGINDRGISPKFASLRNAHNGTVAQQTDIL